MREPNPPQADGLGVGDFVGGLVGGLDGLGGEVGDWDGAGEVLDGLGFGLGVDDWLLLPDGDGVVEGLALGEPELLGDADLLGEGHEVGAADA